MNSLSKTAKGIVRNISIFLVIEVVLGIVLINALLDRSLILGYILGAIYGTLIAMARVVHLDKSLNASIELGEQSEAVKYFRFKYFIRTIGTALALGFAFWLNSIININFVAVAIGLLNAPMSVCIYKLMNKNSNG